MPLSLILTDKNCTLRALLKAQYPRPSSPDLRPALEVMGTHYPILRLAVDDGYLSWLSEELGCRTSEVQHHLVVVYADAARIRPAIAARLHETR